MNVGGMFDGPQGPSIFTGGEIRHPRDRPAAFSERVLSDGSCQVVRRDQLVKTS